jgi:hypothetical protein
MRRLWLIHANVRSATQRRGRFSKPGRGQLAKIHPVPLLEPFPGPDLQNLLGRGLGRAIDHLDLHAECLLDPILASTSVTRVHPQLRKPRQARTSRFEQPTDAVLVWDLGAVDLGFDHQTLGVHQQMPLPAADVLASVEAPLLAAYPGALGLLCASTIPALGSGSLPSFFLKVVAASSSSTSPRCRRASTP